MPLAVMGYARRTALAAWLLAPALALAQAAVPAAAFFQDPAHANARISPDGRQVVMTAAGEKGVRTGLVVVDLETMTPRVIARFPNADVATPYWLNEKRLVFGVVNITPGDTDSSAGLYAIDADGGKLTGIEKNGAVKRRFDQMPCFACGERSMDSLVQHSPERSDNFFIHVRFGGENGIGKVNARTRIIDEVDVPNWSYAWAVDDEERVRVTLSMGDGQTVLNYRGRTGDWRKVARFDPNAGDAFYPVLFANDALYVASRKGGNESGIYRYDLEQGRIADEPLVSAPGFDVVTDWLSDGKKIAGVRVTTDAQRTVWFDAQMKQLQEEIDALLPNTVNRVQRPHRSQTPYLLVDAYSPSQPNAWLAFNRDTKKLTRLGAAFPDIEPARMGTMEFVRYAARDGLQIPAYVTLPRTGNGKNLPAVVLIGHSPTARSGAWSWQPEVQFLASRGYAVIQPQLRGTPGFGLAYLRAGHKQRDTGMQNDVADAAKWAVAQGIADPGRICIIGSAAGGHTALSALHKDAPLFRCGAGIAALGAMPGVLKQPVLLAYGSGDPVMAGEGKKLADTLRASGNAQVEFEVYDEQGQSGSLAASRIDLWTRIARFLERHNGQR